MGSRRARAAVHATLLIASGSAAMLAWRAGFYANFALALLVAVWLVAMSVAVADRHAETTPSPLPPPGEDQRTQRRLIAYLNLSPAPLVMLDWEKRLWAINRAARRLFKADDLIPAPPAALITAIASTPPGQMANVSLDRGGEIHASALMTTDLDGAGGGIGAGDRIAALVDIDAALKAAEARALRDSAGRAQP